jgi:RES domain-containing protein
MLQITDFSGTAYRVLALAYYRTAFSPKGARLYAGRFNRPGISALYVALEPDTAFAEYHRGNDPRPSVMVAARVAATNVIDLCGDLSALATDWQQWDSDWESARDDAIAGKPADCSSWRCGDEAIARHCTGIIFPSRQRPAGRNLALFLEDATSGALNVQLIDPKGEILAANPPKL